MLPIEPSSTQLPPVLFVPAITKAGLEPYRVDRDPNGAIPIEMIEAGIREADVCLAEISLDRPNVWYELGFAIAAQKEVVLLCIEDRRTTFPFDVQHRRIIHYKTDSPRDLDKLKQQITIRLTAILSQQSRTANAGSSPIVTGQYLDDLKIDCLATIAQWLDSLDSAVFSGVMLLHLLQCGQNQFPRQWMTTWMKAIPSQTSNAMERYADNVCPGVRTVSLPSRFLRLTSAVPSGMTLSPT